MKASTFRSLKRIAISLVAAGLLLLILIAFVYLKFFAVSNKGSVELALKYSSLLSDYNDPTSVSLSNEDIWVINCDNGEWMMGMSKDSHGGWRRGGGTVVTKDSSGVVRSYYGHVCGGFPFRGYPTESLAVLYENISVLEFKALGSNDLE